MTPKSNLERSNVVDCPACGARCLPKFAVHEENERLRAELLKFAEWLERDRREPDKILCVVQSMRRAAR